MENTICALMLGRDGSQGFPGKNTASVLGRPLMAYPILAAQGTPRVSRVYVSTDSPGIKAAAVRFGARVIDRPAELCTPQALGEDAFVHGYRVIRDEAAQEGKTLELVVLLFCNAATVTSELIDEGIAALRARPDLDSAVSVSRYNMWSPLRARRENKDGTLEPFVPFEAFGDPKTLNCDRDSQGDVWFADMGLSIVRPRCLERLSEGLLPQKWMGRRIHPLKQWGGCDVDYDWQLPGVEFWLRRHGFSEAPAESAGQPEKASL
ncbi:MAG: cytidylyltransferase [Elusimicrobia bacterium]|nr:cytidylyltransferase [Elusimicrobiota bacterium]